MAPIMPVVGGFKLNGLYEALCVLLLFPAVIVAGAHSSAGLGLEALCRFSGRISYPIYITHFPFLYIYANLVLTAKAPASLTGMVSNILPLGLVLFAWAMLKLYDEPVRIWLKHRFADNRR
jgi:peptidoglycan/LPS O-acetylase OafA/YrhL